MNVPKLRFKEFDGEWEEKKLKDLILTVEAGVSVNSKDASVSDTVSKAVLKTSAISKGNFNQKENKKVIEEDLERVKKPVKADTILVSRMNTPALVGEVGYVENDYPNLYLPDRLWEVEVDKEITTAKWLVSALVTDKNEYKIKSLGTGTSGSMKNIAKSDFLNIDIKVPNLKEQIKIQSFIGILNKKIQLQQQKIDLLQQQKKGYMQKIFNIDLNRELNSNLNFEWKETKIGNIVSSFSGGTPSITNKNYYNGEIPFIRSGELHSHTTELFLSEEGLEKSSAKLVQEGDLLYALYGATSGEVEISKIAGAINQAILCLRPKEDNKYFLRYWLEYKKDYILKTYLQGGQGNLSASIIKSLNIYLPSHERQENIAIFFLQLDERINFEKEKKILLQKQKQGFMQQMFI